MSIQQVRVLIPDTDTTDPILTDEQIQLYLDIARGASPLRAAALALRAIANSQVLLLKVVRTDDIQVDGAKVADSLGKRADSYDAQADDGDAGDDSSVYGIVPFEYNLRDPWAWV